MGFIRFSDDARRLLARAQSKADAAGREIQLRDYLDGDEPAVGVAQARPSLDRDVIELASNLAISERAKEVSSKHVRLAVRRLALD